MMRATLAATLAAAFVAGCQTIPREPKVEVQTVRVPVVQPCVSSDVPARPAAYADDNLPTAPDKAAERYQLTAAANEQRKARLAVLEPVIAACR